MIPFTQYLLPNGQRKQVTIDRDNETETVAHQLIDKGYRFEIEMLTTRHISMTVVDPDDTSDIAIEICDNDPEVLKAIDRLVRSAAEYEETH